VPANIFPELHGPDQGRHASPVIVEQRDPKLTTPRKPKILRKKNFHQLTCAEEFVPVFRNQVAETLISGASMPGIVF